MLIMKSKVKQSKDLNMQFLRHIHATLANRLLVCSASAKRTMIFDIPLFGLFSLFGCLSFLLLPPPK